MKPLPAVALVLIVFATIGLASPLLATSVTCAEDGGTDCCGFDCFICLCCSHSPQTALSELDRRSGGGLDGRLGPEKHATPREPLTQDILHVPRSAPIP